MDLGSNEGPRIVDWIAKVVQYLDISNNDNNDDMVPLCKTSWCGYKSLRKLKQKCPLITKKTLSRAFKNSTKHTFSS